MGRNISKKHIFFLVLILGLTSVLIVARSDEKERLLTTSSRAAGGNCSGDPDTDDTGCTNGGNNSCNWVCNERPPGTTLTVPPCCADVKQSGDPHKCCFDALRRCTQDVCDAIPEENRKTCGDPPGPCRCGQLRALGLCSGGGTNPTNTPGPNVTTPPNITQPPPQGGGKVQIKVHLDSAIGPLWNKSSAIEVYIEGPASAGNRFGELLKVYGTSQSSCRSQGGFPYECSPGAASWNGADGTSGTAAGQYSVQIMKTPQNVTIKEGANGGSLSPNSTLVLDLVVSASGSGNTPTTIPDEPTTTPDPAQTVTPRPTKRPKPTKTPSPTPRNRTNNSSNIIDTVREIFNPPQSQTITIPPSFSGLTGPFEINLPPVVGSTVQEIDTRASQGLTAVGSLFQEVQRLDNNLENTVNEIVADFLNR